MKRLAAWCMALALVAPSAAWAQGPRASTGAIPGAQAFAAGRAADAAVLARLIAAGDAALVRQFNGGLDAGGVAELPEAMEALVVTHFDHPAVGEALRDLRPAYRSRALFDKHLARIRATHGAREPSFRQILRTRQPGIEDALLALANRFPDRPDDASELAYFLAARRHPAAVPMLLEALERRFRADRGAHEHNPVLRALLRYPSPEVWRRASAQLDRLRSEGRIKPEAYAAARGPLDRALADPAATVAQQQRAAEYEAFHQVRKSLAADEQRIAALQEVDAARYVSEREGYLRRLESAAADAGRQARQDVASGYLLLGGFARFRMGDASLGVRIFERAAALDDAAALVLLGDTHQLAFGDATAALAAYERALAEATQPGSRKFSPEGHPWNAFWREWLAAEVAFLRTGKPFRGRISARAIEGFHGVLFSHVALAAGLEGRAPTAVPASRFAWYQVLPAMTTLPPEQLLRELERHDPSGFWTACLLGAVLYIDGLGEAGPDVAEATKLAELLPGLDAPGKPLQAAARRFMDARGLRVRREPDAARR